MFVKKNPLIDQLETEIVRIQDHLAVTEVDEDNYATLSDRLRELYQIREEATTSKKTISPDVVLTTACNLIGIGMIVEYERVHVIASKALSFVLKTR